MGSFSKEHAITAQNAATAAATLLQGKDVTMEQYEEVRTSIFQGSLALAGAETVVQVFEGETAVAPAPSSQPAPSSPTSNSGGPGEVVVNFGKFRGKTIAQIAEADESYLEWLSNEANNDYIKNMAKRFLAA